MVYLIILPTQVTHHQTLPSKTKAVLLNTNYLLKFRPITPLLHFPHLKNTFLPKKIGQLIYHNLTCEFYSTIILLLLNILLEMFINVKYKVSLYNLSLIYHAFYTFNVFNLKKHQDANSSDKLLILTQYI